jgi:serine phosphatase RsbU (regulator of sigma subunit)/anti-sigma regulatory factor (Ser/Thr protein kinase)
MSSAGPAPSDRPELHAPLLLRRWAPVAVLGVVLALAAIAAAVSWRQYDDRRDTVLGDLKTRVVLTNFVFQVYFNGAISLLNSVAAAPVVRSGDPRAMSAYFHRLQPKKNPPFNAGIGWIDAHGQSQASSTRPAGTKGANVADRTYFKQVMKTGQPYVSEGLIGRNAKRSRLVVMAVPTVDGRGRRTGVLAGAINVGAISAAALAQFGLAGASIFDRSGQNLVAGFTKPRNIALLQRMRKATNPLNPGGIYTDTRGLDGRSGHVVAYANTPLAGWTLAVDRSRSSLFASAQRALLLELLLIAGVAMLVFGLFLWSYVRGRRDADRRRVRELLRSELARTLGAATNVNEVAGAVASALESAFPAALGVIALAADDDGRMTVAARSEGELPRRLAEHQEVLGSVAAVADPSVRVAAIETHAELRNRLRELDAAVDGAAGSVYVLPLLTGAGLQSGLLVLLFGTEHGLSPDEQSLIASHAEQSARVLERARVQEREHNVAITLQRALLAQSLPTVVSFDMAQRYEAGSAGLEVGGDWYDVVLREDGLALAIVGDVAGRGVTAATLMGRLRSAFQAYASDLASPAEILRRLVRHVAYDEMATAVVLAIDPYTREVTYASAGHLPPVLADGDGGEPELLQEAGGPPLGALPIADVVMREATTTLPPRATLIAYTDGLIERRGESIDVGIELVRRVLGETTSLGADAVAGRVLAEAAERVGGEDDVALLVLRSVELPDRMEVEIPADPPTLRGTRRRLQRWLTLHGVDEEQRCDAVLAVSEACNNAIEHAYRNQGGTIRLSLSLEDGLLRIHVEDRGLWRLDSDRGVERGRGLPIMRGVMDSVEIERRSGGTLVRFEQRLRTAGPEAALKPA